MAGGTERYAFCELLQNGFGQHMTRKMWLWVTGVAVLAAIDLAATIHAHATWKRSSTGPSVTSLGQVLGFVTSFGLLVLLVLLIVGGVRSARRRRNSFRR
jgi:uncharacterized membrane protein